MVAKPCDLDDHITWLQQHGRFEEACKAAEGKEAQLRTHDIVVRPCPEQKKIKKKKKKERKKEGRKERRNKQRKETERRKEIKKRGGRGEEDRKRRRERPHEKLLVNIHASSSFS